MNFSIHIDDNTVKELVRLVRDTGKSRNALINEAIRKLVEAQKRKEWPSEVLELFGAEKDLEPFESHRNELKSVSEDPFA
ncbi:MAG: CopG family transcriptional regulator [Deltaproteobacteria bacterium]|nr:CopG family transcriptional regulator [Deltaproteobacteria bacterium]